MSDEGARLRYWTQKREDWASWSEATPNAAHHAIYDLDRAGRLEAVVTQNVDGLHTRVGHSSVIEIHGTNLAVECQSCGRRRDPLEAFAELDASGRAPRCRCGGLDKPATISFGQQLSSAVLDAASAAAGRADLVLAVGSTLQVTPAAHVPLMAAQRGIPYVVINRGETAHDDLPEVTLRLHEDLTEILPLAVAQVLA